MDEQVDMLTVTTKELDLPLISHPVKAHVKEAVGIPEGEPVALAYHFTRANLGYNVMEHGFVNVSGRGTLASALDLGGPGENDGVPGVMESQANRHSENVMLITFCLPAKLLRKDSEGRYGMWYDNKLAQGEHPELWEVYNGIATEYNDQTGKPIKWAKDDPKLYPVYIPPQYILGVAQPSGAVLGSE